MEGITVGFALCGSFCTFEKALALMEKLVLEGAAVLPIMSNNAFSTDTRFGEAKEFVRRIEAISGRRVISTIADAEPIGPKGLCDVMLVAPCTGNTLAKLAHGVVDTSVTMAVKSHVRNARPVVIAVSTNDGLAAAAKNIAELLNRKCFYFVPFKQDDSEKKPTSLVAELSLASRTMRLALTGRQIQPVIQY